MTWWDDFRLQRREHYQRDELGQDMMPGEHLTLTVMTTGKAGEQVLDGFGTLRIRAMAGRGLAIEVTDELNHVVVAAQVDVNASRRTHLENLDAPLITRAIADASREDGPEEWIFPEPH